VEIGEFIKSQMVTKKLTVGGFICAWVAAHKMRMRGYSGDQESERKPLFGGISVQAAEELASKLPAATNSYFTHADLGTGCGGVLMLLAWAFLVQIRSVDVEAQEGSYDCLQRSMLWNLGRDGLMQKTLFVRRGLIGMDLLQEMLTTRFATMTKTSLTVHVDTS
jgi:hypothetical protein